MRHWKTALALLLAFALALPLAACGDSAGGPSVPALNTLSADEMAAILAAPITGEITVSCYDTTAYKNFLETAAAQFEAIYPGTKVNVETASALPEVKTAEMGDGMMVASIQVEDDPQARTDYINKVGTALMSGNGADLYAMDVLPIHKYVAGGQLEELSAYMDADPAFNRADYRTNIFDAVRYMNGTWFLPLDYDFNYYTYDSTLLSGDAYGFGVDSAFSAEQLMDIGKSAYAPELAAGVFNVAGYGGPRGGGGYLSKLIEANYKTFIDLANGSANFDDGAFAALLESVNQYGSAGYVNQNISADSEGNFMSGGMMGPDGPAAVTDRYFFKDKTTVELQQYFNRNSGLKMAFFSAGSKAAVEDDDEIAGIAALADGQVPFTYSQAYGINAASQNKATAWAFLKFLLSEEMQTSPSLTMMGLPVHNAARAKKAEDFFSGSFMMAGGARMGTGARTATPEGDAPAGDGNTPMFFTQNPDGTVSVSDTPPEGEGEPAQEGNRVMRTGPGEATGEATGEMTDEQRAVMAQYLDAVERMSDQINSFLIRDGIVDDMIAEQVPFYFDGTKTAAEAAAAIQSKASLYLGE